MQNLQMRVQKLQPSATLPLRSRAQSKPKLIRDSERRYLLEGYRTLVPRDARMEPHLRGVLDDSLAHAGSLVRAQLVFGILRGAGAKKTLARQIAVAIEYFHTASLIFDDMPSMDDAVERRGNACPHVTWGEAAATLGALGLINQAYALLWNGIQTLPVTSRRRAAALVRDSLGVSGILDGQSRDVHFERNAAEADVLEVAEGKTVTLIRLTLLLPSIVAGDGAQTRARLNRLARAWGLAYQIVDDFKDCLLSRDEAGKTTERDELLSRPNLPRRAGLASAMSRLDALLSDARDEVLALARAGGARWRPVLALQEILEKEQAAIARRVALRVCA
ncbi:MAG: polyprenyl synthetase family protein [Acidobacteria bacterium]|nr:polyprenyl synthetase family protein [Acidobacteriota bacterium]